jgi:hypothetical protein
LAESIPISPETVDPLAAEKGVSKNNVKFDTGRNEVIGAGKRRSSSLNNATMLRKIRRKGI